MSAGNHEHEWRHLGLRYWVSDRPCPGTGATDVHYFDAYFCARCLESQLVPIEIQQAGSYFPRLPGSAPVTEADAQKLHKQHGGRW